MTEFSFATRRATKTESALLNRLIVSMILDYYFNSFRPRWTKHVGPLVTLATWYGSPGFSSCIYKG